MMNAMAPVTGQKKGRVKGEKEVKRGRPPKMMAKGDKKKVKPVPAHVTLKIYDQEKNLIPGGPREVTLVPLRMTWESLLTHRLEIEPEEGMLFTSYVSPNNGGWMGTLKETIGKSMKSGRQNIHPTRPISVRFFRGIANAEKAAERVQDQYSKPRLVTLSKQSSQKRYSTRRNDTGETKKGTLEPNDNTDDKDDGRRMTRSQNVQSNPMEPPEVLELEVEMVERDDVVFVFDSRVQKIRRPKLQILGVHSLNPEVTAAYPVVQDQVAMDENLPDNIQNVEPNELSPPLSNPLQFDFQVQSDSQDDEVMVIFEGCEVVEQKYSHTITVTESVDLGCHRLPRVVDGLVDDGQQPGPSRLMNLSPPERQNLPSLNNNGPVYDNQDDDDFDDNASVMTTASEEERELLAEGIQPDPDLKDRIFRTLEQRFGNRRLLKVQKELRKLQKDPAKTDRMLRRIPKAFQLLMYMLGE